MSNNFYQTKEGVSQYIKMAQDVDSSQLIEKLKSHLPNGAALLELGSGPGTDWQLLKQSFDVTGSDYSAEFIKHLKAEIPNGEFFELDAATLDIDKKFDAIYSNKVLHHLSDAKLASSIVNQDKILKPNGIICHSFWKGVGDEIFNGLFVNYYEATDLKKAFEKSFEIISIETYKEFDADDSLVLIAKKK
ncbi:MAG: class I SAM-dependent methyltransferase [Bacteroidia bacterium]